LIFHIHAVRRQAVRPIDDNMRWIAQPRGR
jgi:hypothetical protein